MNDLLCVCEVDPMWLCQFRLGEEVVDEYLADYTITSPVVTAQAVAEKAFQHVALAEQAMAEGRLDWEARMVCPTCRGGTIINVHGIHDVRGEDHG